MDKKNAIKAGEQGANSSNEIKKEAEVRELGKNLPAVRKKAMELPQVIKAVEELHAKVKHRDRLEFYEGQLADFDIQRQEEDLADKSYYQGCILILKDDGNGKFELKNPTLIKDVVIFLQGKMMAKRLELETEIVLPAA